MIRIKICCIASPAEAALALAAGADVLGLVAAMPSGPGPISDTAIAEIAATLPAGVLSLLLTAETTATGSPIMCAAPAWAGCRSSATSIPTSRRRWR